MKDNKESKSDWPALLLLFIALPLAFTYGGMWIGLLVLVVGVEALGWSKRHELPFPTKRNIGAHHSFPSSRLTCRYQTRTNDD